jgi:hypothetical protein
VFKLRLSKVVGVISIPLGAIGAGALGILAPPEVSDTPAPAGTFVFIILFTDIKPWAIVAAAAINEKGGGRVDNALLAPT